MSADPGKDVLDRPPGNVLLPEVKFTEQSLFWIFYGLATMTMAIAVYLVYLTTSGIGVGIWPACLIVSGVLAAIAYWRHKMVLDGDLSSSKEELETALKQFRATEAKYAELGDRTLSAGASVEELDASPTEDT